MNVRDAMAEDVRTVTTDDSVAAAARAMRDAGTGFLPVLEGGRPGGVITDRDLVVRFLAEGGADAESAPVGELMSRKVVTIGPDDDLGAAGDAMRSEEVRRLVVVDEVVGQWVSLLLLPFTLWTAVAGFALFRLMDVIKPWPARDLERLPGGIGIVADDLMAGVYANLLLRVGLTGWPVA